MLVVHNSNFCAVGTQCVFGCNPLQIYLRKIIYKELYVGGLKQKKCSL